MNDSADTPTPPPIELSQADERALDALLSEALGSTTRRRDFSSDLLARLHRQQQSVCLQRGAVVPRPERRSASMWAVAAAAVAMLAACVLAIVLWRGPLNRVIQFAQPVTETAPSPAAGLGELADSSAGGTGSPQPDRSVQQPPAALSRPVDAGRAAPELDSAVAASKPQRRPPVVLSDGLANSGRATDKDEPSSQAERESIATSSGSQPRGGDATLADFDGQFTAYWKALGVTPAPLIDQTQWLARIAERFGLQPDRSAGLGMVEEAFSDPQACRELAQRLVDQLLVGLRPSQPRRETLVQEASEVIFSGGRFDRWLSGLVIDDAWINDRSDGRGHDPAVVGQWVAERVIGADVGCARCHDSPIDSRYVQHDFWAMAGLFSPPAGPPLFYELADGRQRVATAGVPVRWFGLPANGEGSAPLTSREELAEQLLNHPQVARTLANHLWTVGFGMPLVAAASSPLAPPRDDTLDQALAMLGDRLLSENFDIRAAARWVIACDPMKRGVPEDLIDAGWQIAGESELAAASLAQRSFAAAKVNMPQANRNQLLAMMQSRGREAPATLTAPDAVLAQPLAISPQQPGKPNASRRDTTAAQRGSGAGANLARQEDYWWSQWLADREGLRGGWLESIRDSDQRLRHAFYAAGYRNVDRQLLQTAEALLAATQQSDLDRSETVAQIHWILQNSK